MPGTPPRPTEDLPVPSGKAKHTTVRLRGTVSDGVEQGCKVLTSKGVTYLLVWRQGTLVSGVEMELEGTLAPELTTTCQQGTPFVVERVLKP